MSYVLLLLTVGATIYALVDCWRSTDDEVRGLPRAAWLIVIVLIWLVGPVAYLVFGRNRATVRAVGRPRVTAPDDDPEFLRQLDTQQRKAAAEKRRQREQQERRERKDRERQERQQRKEQQQRLEQPAGDQDPSTPETPDGEDHPTPG